MSWGEDMGFDAFSYDDFPSYIFNEEHWKNGIHYDRGDNRHEITKMTTEHIENTIRYFKNNDTTPLKLELKRRQKITKKSKK